MKKKSYKNNHLRLSVSTIIKRLPLHRQLNASQSALIDFSHTWDTWSSQNLASGFSASTTLNSFRNGVLTIRCISTVAASQLKHLQVSLLETFHQAGLTKIVSIKIQIDHDVANFSEQESDIANTLAGQKVPNTLTKKGHFAAKADVERNDFLPTTIETIKNCQKSVRNERLNESLQRLANTLEADSKKQD